MYNEMYKDLHVKVKYVSTCINCINITTPVTIYKTHKQHSEMYIQSKNNNIPTYIVPRIYLS